MSILEMDYKTDKIVAVAKSHEKYNNTPPVDVYMPLKERQKHLKANMTHPQTVCSTTAEPSVHFPPKIT